MESACTRIPGRLLATVKYQWKHQDGTQQGIIWIIISWICCNRVEVNLFAIVRNRPHQTPKRTAPEVTWIWSTFIYQSSVEVEEINLFQKSLTAVTSTPPVIAGIRGNNTSKVWSWRRRLVLVMFLLLLILRLLLAGSPMNKLLLIINILMCH